MSIEFGHRPTLSSSVIPFSFCLQSFPASGSFLVSQFFASGGQSIGASASASVLPMNIQDLFPLGWTGWISLQSKGLSRVFSNTTFQKHQFFNTQPSLWSNSHAVCKLRKPASWKSKQPTGPVLGSLYLKGMGYLLQRENLRSAQGAEILESGSRLLSLCLFNFYASTS